MANDAFSRRWLWMWDHSTNWQPGQLAVQTHGASNPYLKSVRDFLDDYKRVIDYAEAEGINEERVIEGLL